MEALFEVAAGTVTGREHMHAHRNNQDAYIVERSPKAIVAVVCDGCSSGRFSEVGALMGARLFATGLLSLADRMTNPGDTNYMVEWVRNAVLREIRTLASAMGPSLSTIVNDYFLFTVMAAIINDERTTVIGIGDGIYAVNGVVMSSGPFPGNAPPYAAYALTGSSVSDTHPEMLKFATHAVIPTEQVSTLLIGTDGVGDLVSVAERALPGHEELVGPVSQFWENDRFYKNPYILSRRLNQVNPPQTVVRIRENGGIDRFEGLLPDDTTLAVVRRRNGA